MEEDGSALFEFVGVFGGVVLAGTTGGDIACHLRMTLQIVLEAGGDIFTLWNDAHAGSCVFHNLWHEQREVCAAENDGVNIGVFLHELVNALLDEVVGAGRVGFIVFDERHPERTCLSCDTYLRPQLGDLHVVAVRAYRTFGSEQSYMVVARELSDDLCSGTDDSEDTTMGIECGEVALLDGAQCLGRGGIAAENDKMAAHLKELQYSLARELINHLEGARAVGSTRVVAQIEIVILGQQLSDAVQDRQSAVSAVEDTDRSGRLRKGVVHNLIAWLAEWPATH